MNVPKIGLIERIFKPKKSQQIKQSSTVQKSDEVSISSSALRKSRDGADERIQQIVRNAPDIRIDKVNEIKEKIERGDYFNSINYNDLAEKMLQSPFNLDVNIKSI